MNKQTEQRQSRSDDVIFKHDTAKKLIRLAMEVTRLGHRIYENGDEDLADDIWRLSPLDEALDLLGVPEDRTVKEHGGYCRDWCIDAIDDLILGRRHIDQFILDCLGQAILVQDVIGKNRTDAVIKPADNCIDYDRLRILCDTVVRLTELALKGCPSMCIENFAAFCLRNMLTVLKKYEGSK